jgi:hypothetical protein
MASQIGDRTCQHARDVPQVMPRVPRQHRLVQDPDADERLRVAFDDVIAALPA